MITVKSIEQGSYCIEHMPLRKTVPLKTQHAQPHLRNEQLFKLQAVNSPQVFVSVGGEVYLLKSLVSGDEFISAYDRHRQVFRQFFFIEMSKEVIGQLPDLSSTQPPGLKFFRTWINGFQEISCSASFSRNQFHFGMGYLWLVHKKSRPAKYLVLTTGMQRFFYPLYALEPYEFQFPGIIPEVGHQTPAPFITHYIKLCEFTFHLYIFGGFRYGMDRSDLGFVDVPVRKKFKQVFKTKYAQFFF